MIKAKKKKFVFTIVMRPVCYLSYVTLLSFLIFLLLGLFMPGEGRSTSTLISKKFYSKSLGTTKRYMIYLPKSYSRSKKRLPSLYLLHGLGAHEKTWSQLGIKEIADAMNLNAVIVMPDGDRGLYIDSPLSSYESYITIDLIREIEKEFTVSKERKFRAILGESMGGYGALTLAFRNPKLFSVVGSHSGITRIIGKKADTQSLFFPHFQYQLKKWRAHNPIDLVKSAKRHDFKIYIDCGSEDPFLKMNKEFHRLLVREKIEHEFYTPKGKHHDDFFKKRIKHSLKFALKHFNKN